MIRLVPDEVILGLLKQRPAHGYDLLERFKSKSHLGRIWNMSTSQLYAVLKRLEENGLIKGSQVDVQDAPARIEFSITEEGNKRLNAWLYDNNPPTSIHRIRVMFLSRLYIGFLLDLQLDEVIKAQIDVCEEQKSAFEEAQRQSSSEIETLANKYIIGQLDAALTWLYDVRDQYGLRQKT